MPKNWKKEVARDTLALGSIPFYFIVMIRAIIGEYMPFVYHLGIAFLILIFLDRVSKNFNKYIARGLVLVIFTSFFYQAETFTIFAVLLWISMIFSLVYLKTKYKEIVTGIIFGFISSAVSYYLVSLI